MTDYTDEERQTLRTAAFGAVFLVSAADPGFFATIKESLAGSKALASASPELQNLFKSGGVPKLPKGSPAELEATVLSALQQSTTILQAKAPTEVDGFRTAVVTACDDVAGASGGVKDSETAAISKVKTALGVG
ncbi:MAG TPA: hypothetical protein VFE14_15390 [Micromonosporaceae bacterium]|nr:hypothetical protein [Micromonosporaceae bacterium]